MGKIYCIMGKSSTGKDTIYKRVLECCEGRFGTICPYTTRPIRDGEQEGVEYHFVSREAFEALSEAGKVIESRTYNTVYGEWTYFTADDGQIEPDGKDYLLIMTLEGYRSLASYFGKERVVPVYIEVEDGLRLERAVKRERQQRTPKYAELCRRFLADAADFSEEKLQEIEGLIRIGNYDLDECVESVLQVLREN